jgi:hypothetical protein
VKVKNSVGSFQVARPFLIHSKTKAASARIWQARAVRFKYFGSLWQREDLKI